MTTALKFPTKTRLLNHFEYDALTDQTELLWRCSHCGELIHRKDWLPGRCPSCDAPQREFNLVEED